MRQQWLARAPPTSRMSRVQARLVARFTTVLAAHAAALSTLGASIVAAIVLARAVLLGAPSRRLARARSLAHPPGGLASGRRAARAEATTRSLCGTVQTVRAEATHTLRPTQRPRGLPSRCSNVQTPISDASTRPCGLCAPRPSPHGPGERKLVHGALGVAHPYRSMRRRFDLAAMLPDSVCAAARGRSTS